MFVLLGQLQHLEIVDAVVVELGCGDELRPLVDCVEHGQDFDRRDDAIVFVHLNPLGVLDDPQQDVRLKDPDNRPEVYRLSLREPLGERALELHPQGEDRRAEQRKRARALGLQQHRVEEQHKDAPQLAHVAQRRRGRHKRTSRHLNPGHKRVRGALGDKQHVVPAPHGRNVGRPVIVAEAARVAALQEQRVEAIQRREHLADEADDGRPRARLGAAGAQRPNRVKGERMFARRGRIEHGGSLHNPTCREVSVLLSQLERSVHLSERIPRAHKLW
eukprot:Amastigsp_a177466_9.p2 type:complete len:275 gc:universal Amastigsp_a177466_9:1184-360(-)